MAPLSVAQQTVREASKFGIECEYSRSGDFTRQIVTCNYEMLSHFDPSLFGGVVIDESSILKAFDGKTRNEIIGSFRDTPFRLACTATPSPNDFMELGNHSEFLGIMTTAEMLSKFFFHDGGDTQTWTLKGHAEDEFWKWVCSWAVMIRRPSDDQLHVSWAKDGPRYAVRTGSPKATAEWDAWILDEVRRHDVDVAA